MEPLYYLVRYDGEEEADLYPLEIGEQGGQSMGSFCLSLVEEKGMVIAHLEPSGFDQTRRGRGASTNLVTVTVIKEGSKEEERNLPQNLSLTEKFIYKDITYGFAAE
jgi:hypothetical protein